MPIPPCHITYSLPSELEKAVAGVPARGVLFVVPDRTDFDALAPLLGWIEARRAREGADACPVLRLPDGEAHKTLGSVSLVWDFLLAHYATRSSVLVCVGGGVVTDVGGFAAATYKRGIRFVHIPTTLLAMVDAAIGGKTGFDYRGLKNSIGAFACPSATLVYPPYLQTLPTTELLGGYAEMVKHALVGSRAMWQRLLAFDVGNLLGGHPEWEAFTPLLEESSRFKERIVGEDPEELGIRQSLNFGHTVGHALEAYYQAEGRDLYPDAPAPSHGYCVLWGMVAELYLSVTERGMSHEALQQVEALMRTCYGKPVCRCTDRAVLLRYMRQDKKNRSADGVVFVLLDAVGTPVPDCVVPLEKIEEAIDYLMNS